MKLIFIIMIIYFHVPYGRKFVLLFQTNFIEWKNVAVIVY